MRILVTGGAGYIGSATTEVLLDRGDQVVVYDNLSRGHRDAVDPRAVFVEGDLADVPRVRAAIDAHGIQSVVHIAGAALVSESMTNPAKYYRTNVVAGLGLLEAMRDTGVRNIVFSSSCAVYGIPERLPIDETLPTRPVNPYGESKLTFEGLLRWFHAAHGFSTIALRYFNAAGASARYGERHEPESHLIPLVLDVAAGKRPAITLNGTDYPTRDGTCVRDYIHILDLADAHVLAVQALEAGAPRNEVFNLGCGGEGHTNREVVDCARKVTGGEIPVQMGPRRPGDPPILVASPARATAALGWRPQRASLEAIITSAWTWMNSRDRQPAAHQHGS